MTLGEVLSLLGFMGVFLGGIVYIRTELVKIDAELKKSIIHQNLKMLELEQRLCRHEEKLNIATDYFQVETEKLNKKLESKMDKMDLKLDHLVEVVSQIRVSVAEVSCRQK